MSMEEKQNSQTFLDFNQSVLKPSTREQISEIIRESYKKNIHVIAEIHENNWNNKKYLQLSIKDILIKVN